MSDCNSNINPALLVSAISRSNRGIEALHPLYFNIDDRTETDFLIYIEKLSQYVHYYDTKNVLNGNWSQFFKSDNTFILLIITNWNIQILKSHWDTLVNEVDAIQNNTEKKEKIITYFQNIQAQINLYKNEIAKIQDDVMSIKDSLLQRIPAISNLIQALESTINTQIDIIACINNPIFNKQVFQLFGYLESWQKQCEPVVQHLLDAYNGHHPHIALMITFVKLLQHVQKELNSFSQKHLDFYYRDILRITTKPSVADTVHLIIDSKNNAPFTIPKYTVFPAGKNSKGIPRLFHTNQDSFITNIGLQEFIGSHYHQKNQYHQSLISTINQEKGISLFNTESAIHQDSIIVCSPILFLKSGQRTISIKLLRSGQISINIPLSFKVSGSNKWIEWNDVSPNAQGVYLLEIDADDVPITKIDAKIHNSNIHAPYPALCIMFGKNTNEQNIEDIILNVAVANMQSFAIKTDIGFASIDKPFFPFGNIPIKGNAFDIYAKEFFIKKNAKAAINLFFDKDSFSSFNAQIWDNKRDTKSINLNSIEHQHIAKEWNDTEIPYEATAIKVLLNDALYEANGYMDQYIAESKKDTPALPYLPKINKVVFNYQTPDYSLLKTDKALATVYKNLPFGVQQYTSTIPYEPINEATGVLYLGFNNVTTQTTFHCLFQIQAGSFNPLVPPASVDWYYLNGNIWTEIHNQFIHDDTNQLLHSGMIIFTLPVFNPEQNTIMPNNLFWLKAKISDKKGINNIIGIHTQVVIATQLLNGDNNYETPIPPSTISKTEKAFKQNFKITQPYASFGGSIKEPSHNYERRVSEHLRHKGRAITNWDYAHILLEAFPEIGSVKTINHYVHIASKIHAAAAGYLTIVPIAKNQYTNNPHWSPFLSQANLAKYKKYLETIVNPHARIQLSQPQLEKVSIQCKVKFKDSYHIDKTLMLQELIDHINHFLAPWVYSDDEILFVDQIVFSKIIQLIDNFEYVDYITDFKVAQFIINGENEEQVIVNKEIINPQTAYSLFIAHDNHQIEIIN